MTDSIFAWSTTASDNDDADGSINWRENQNPDTVNNSSRAEMARHAEFISDLLRLKTTGGSSTAYTVTATQQPATLPNGFTVYLLPHASNTGSSGCTLNVNGLGAKPLRITSGANASAGDITINKPIHATYYETGDEFLIDSASSDVLATLAAASSVGIGTDSPDGTLHVHSGSAGAVSASADADDLVVESSGAAGMHLLAPDAHSSIIRFGTPTDSTGAAIQWANTNDLFTIGTSKTSSDMRFMSGNYTEAMRIDSNGDVFIGATSGEGKLRVDNSGQTDYIAVFYDDGAAEKGNSIKIDAFRPAIELVDQSGSSGDYKISADGGTFRISFDSDSDGAYSTARFDDSTPFEINSNGRLTFDQYGSGTHTATAQYALAVNASGIVCEEPLSAMDLIGTVTASNDASIAFTGLSSDYFAYQIWMENVQCTVDTADFWVRTSTNNGSSYDSGSSDYQETRLTASSGAMTVGTSASKNHMLIASSNGTASGESLSGVLEIYNPSNTEQTYMLGRMTYENSAGSMHWYNTVGKRKSSADVDAVQILYASGNIQSGTFKLYGMRA